MIDDMMGIYGSTREAVVSGERMGAEDLFRAAIEAIRAISVEFEKKPHDDAMATQGFIVAERCAKAVTNAKYALNARQDGEVEMVGRYINGVSLQ